MPPSGHPLLSGLPTLKSISTTFTRSQMCQRSACHVAAPLHARLTYRCRCTTPLLWRSILHPSSTSAPPTDTVEVVHGYKRRYGLVLITGADRGKNPDTTRDHSPGNETRRDGAPPAPPAARGGVTGGMAEWRGTQGYFGKSNKVYLGLDSGGEKFFWGVLFRGI